MKQTSTLSASKSNPPYRSLLVTLFFLFSTTGNAASIFSAGVGNWDDPSTWSCSCIPGAGDDVIVTHSVTLNVSTAIHGLLLMPSGSITGVSTEVLSIGYDVNIAGSYNVYRTVFNGTEECRITSSSADPYDFTHLDIDKTADVSLKTNISVERNLSLINGDFILSVYDLEIGPSDSGIIVGGTSSSYLQADMSGVVKKMVDGSTTLPTSINFDIGDNDEYSPAVFALNSGLLSGGGFISVNLTDAKHPTELGSDYITRYWTFNSAGFLTIDYDVQYFYLDADIVGTESKLEGSYWNDPDWVEHGDVIKGANMLFSSPSIIIAPSNWDFTGSSGGFAMPIQLLSFHAEVKGSNVVVTWSTAAESNNDRFFIERFQGSEEPDVVASIPGAGNSYTTNNYTFVDNRPLYGLTYYNLKQSDFDGNVTGFSPIAIKYNAPSASMQVYPNPVMPDQSINVVLKGFTDNKEVLVVLLNQYGVEVFSKVVIQEGDAVLTAIDPKEKLSPGLYFVTGASDNNMYKQKIIIR